MTPDNSDTTKPINDVEIGKDSKAATPLASEAELLPDGARPARRGAPLADRLEERRWRRRRSISSLDGLIREHGRLISAIHNDRVPLTKAEVLSRAYGRHREMVAALEQSQQLAAIQEQLKALLPPGAPSVPLLAADTSTKESD